MSCGCGLTRRRFLVAAPVAAAVAVLGVSGCAKDDPNAPPEIDYGRTVCDECGMIIAEPRFAGAYRTADGTPRRFDDLGDMIAFGVETGEIDGARVWVHDYDSEEWLDAPTAWYLLGGSIETPMSRGVLAFSQREQAETYAGDVGGEVLSWAEALDAGRDGRLDPRPLTSASQDEIGASIDDGQTSDTTPKEQP